MPVETSRSWRRRLAGVVPRTARGIWTLAGGVIVAVVSAPLVAYMGADHGPQAIDRATVQARATSSRAPDRSSGKDVITYTADNVLDAEKGSAWVEGAAGPGKGESIAFTFDREVELTGLKIRNGYGRSAYSQDTNNRVRRAVLSDGLGHRQTVLLADASRPQAVAIHPDLARTRAITLTISSVYPGRTDEDDTGLSDVRFYVRR